MGWELFDLILKAVMGVFGGIAGLAILGILGVFYDDF